MSQKERRGIGIMASVQANELNLVKATQVPGLGYRQTKHVWKCYAADDDTGPGHHQVYRAIPGRFLKLRQYATKPPPNDTA